MEMLENEGSLLALSRLLIAGGVRLKLPVRVATIDAEGIDVAGANETVREVQVR